MAKERLKELITLSPNHGRLAMTGALWGIANNEQLAALTRHLDEYVKDMGLVGDTAARGRLAQTIMALFTDGVKPEDMRRHLDASLASF
jgi:hypothetical protein